MLDFGHNDTDELGGSPAEDLENINAEDVMSGTKDNIEVAKPATEAKDPNELPDVKRELFSEALSWGRTIVFAVAFALLLNTLVIVNATVPSASMEGTIRTNDRIVAFRLSYLFSEPSRFDIIVFPNPDDPDTLNVKRAIGLPGEIVTIVNGLVFIGDNPNPLRDDFVHGEISGNFGPFEVPEGHVFVLGDYRSNSRDSRDWINTFVSHDDIQGRVIFRYFPGFKNLSRT